MEVPNSLDELRYSEECSTDDTVASTFYQENKSPQHVFQLMAQTTNHRFQLKLRTPNHENDALICDNIPGSRLVTKGREPVHVLNADKDQHMPKAEIMHLKWISGSSRVSFLITCI